jgi:hypothetical protein
VKYSGKLLGRALVVLDMAYVGYNFTNDLSDAQKIKLSNLER